MCFFNIQEISHTSVRILPPEHNLSIISVYAILKAEKCHFYKVKIIHEFQEDDFDNRINFCKVMMKRCERDLNFSSKIVFSNEESVTPNGQLKEQKFYRKSTLKSNRVNKEIPKFM